MDPAKKPNNAALACVANSKKKVADNAKNNPNRAHTNFF